MFYSCVLLIQTDTPQDANKVSDSVNGCSKVATGVKFDCMASMQGDRMSHCSFLSKPRSE